MRWENDRRPKHIVAHGGQNRGRLGEPALAMVLELADRDGEQQIAVLSGAKALARVIACNTTLTKIQCALPNSRAVPLPSLPNALARSILSSS